MVLSNLSLNINFFFHRRHFSPLQLLQSFPQMTFLDETFKEAIQIVGMCNLAPRPPSCLGGKQFEEQRELG
jgi:hypothetical protein